MIIQKYLFQPVDNSQYLSLFRVALEQGTYMHFDAAFAYATGGGVDALAAVLRQAPHWDSIHKRWLVSIDWCRSEPVALEHLSSLPTSAVRVFDGERVVGRRLCVPILPFHPKTFTLRGDNARSVICGSGNLSRNGLALGHEVGSLLAAVKPLESHEQGSWDSCGEVISWFDLIWG